MGSNPTPAMDSQVTLSKLLLSLQLPLAAGKRDANHVKVSKTDQAIIVRAKPSNQSTNRSTEQRLWFPAIRDSALPPAPPSPPELDGQSIQAIMVTMAGVVGVVGGDATST